MPRQLRIQYEGAIYHLLSRGDRRESIFIDDKDRRQFLATLGRGCLKTGWQVHAYCPMSNHFHLVIETPRPNLVEGMKWLLGTYTMRFNRRHRVSGHLFAGRYKSLLIDGAASDYLRIVCDYVHLNPVRAGLVRKQERHTEPTALLQQHRHMGFRCTAGCRGLACRGQKCRRRRKRIGSRLRPRDNRGPVPCSAGRSKCW